MADKEAPRQNVAWPVCSHEACTGVRAPSGDKCIAHLDSKQLDAELQRLGNEGSLDGRGVEFTSSLLKLIRDALPRDAAGHSQFQEAQFDGSTFLDAADFRGVIFGKVASFRGAKFQDRVSFATTQFHASAHFDGVTFQDDVEFVQARFAGPARFDWMSVQGAAYFNEVTFKSASSFQESSFADRAHFGDVSFENTANFIGVSFSGDAAFPRAIFHSETWFQGATFHRTAWFGEVTFNGITIFNDTTFNYMASFSEALFEDDAAFGDLVSRKSMDFARAVFSRFCQLGPMVVRKALILDGAVFKQQARMEVSASAVCFRGTSFLSAAGIRLRWSTVVLDDADFGGPAILAGTPSFGRRSDIERQFSRVWRRLHTVTPDGRPSIISVRGANLANLAVSNINMAACRFAGAHNLDLLRIEDGVSFGRISKGGVRRQAIAEELDWRVTRGGRIGTALGWPSWLAEPAPLEPNQVAAIYTRLRKGREGVRDRTLAADFYCGEMEMRRLDASTPEVERLLLWLYWLLSGYGLRAARSVLAIAAVVTAAAVFFAQYGFARGTELGGMQSLSRALLFSLQTIAGLDQGTTRLTLVGGFIQVALRVAVLPLFALGALSVYRRVKS
jgi:uncharacterized protein YjbI with pentapeptide repeats